VKKLLKNLIARLSRAGSQQQCEVLEALLSPVPCARCKRWECEKKAVNRGREGRPPEQEYLMCIGLLSRRSSRETYIGEQAWVDEPGRYG
jgi:hypothetical protein